MKAFLLSNLMLNVYFFGDILDFFLVLFMNLLCDASLNINREESFLLVQKLEIFEFIKIK